MCGRYTLSTPAALVAEHFRLAITPPLLPRFNIAPTQEAAVVTGDRESRRLESMTWGLVPWWAEDPATGTRLINARAETAASRPAFRDGFRNRRCLVPADGFYEWRAVGKSRRPFHIRRRDRGLLAFAGLWSAWREEHGDRPLLTFTILTCPPNETVAPLHDRMPVIVPQGAHAAWMDPEQDPDRVASLLIPSPAAELEAVEVSTWVNSPHNEGPGCLRPPEQGVLF